MPQFFRHHHAPSENATRLIGPARERFGTDRRLVCMKKQHLLLIASASALLAACSPSEPDVPLAPSDPAAEDSSSPASPQTADTSPETGIQSGNEVMDAADESLNVEAALAGPAAEGEWIEQPNWTGFGPPASEAVFTIRCGEYGMVTLTRMVDVDPARPVSGVIATAEQSENGYWKGEDGATMPAAHFESYASSPLFEALASADKFAVLIEGQPDLVLPGSDLISARLESCRDQNTP